MAENVPPPSTTAGPSDAQTRGLPYYEKLKKDLRETLNKKRTLDKNMATLEDQIYRYETSYLEETSAGNIIKGFDNYIKGSAAPGSSTTTTNTGGGGAGTSTRRKGGPGMDVDRVFSRSSASFMRELSPPSSAQVSPPGAGTPTGEKMTNVTISGRGGRGDETPTSATSTKGPGLKKRRGEEEEDGKVPKRLKITYNRGGD